jgi:5'-3' exonuclease
MTLMLLDSASLWYRAYYGMPDTMVSPDGQPVNAIRGYLDMTAKLITQYRPNRIVACLDGARLPSWRVEKFPAYKAKRQDSLEKEKSESLRPQIPVLLEALRLFGIPLVGVDDYEADDILASYAHQHDGPTRIVTGDRDLFQSVDDERDVKVIYLAQGFSQHNVVDYDYIAEKYGIPGNRYTLFSLIRGDSSDGLPGVAGIGQKGAALIANNFTCLDDVIEAAHSGHELLPAPLAKKIIAGTDYLSIAPTVVQVARDAVLPQLDLSLPGTPADLTEIATLKEQYGLGYSVDRLINALGWGIL